MKKAQNAEELKLKASFNAIRAIFNDDRFKDRRNLSLVYWTLPGDRRLPLSLLDYSLQRVLDSDFDELAGTPGIGLKKLSSLISLLERAANDGPPTVPIKINPEPLAAPTPLERFRPLDAEGRFDSSLVSEALWQQWRETAVLHELDNERLGRLAPSLLELPTVIWDTPLAAYIPQSLQKIRQLRTYGEKRVRVVLEVFFLVHEMLHQSGRHARLAVRLIPSFVPPLERWFQDVMAHSTLPTVAEMQEFLVLPLIDQLELDVGGEVVQLAKGRLGINGNSVAVRQQSRELGVTRARVYQLLEECDRVMSVRWPEGRRCFNDLRTRLESETPDTDAAEYFNSVYELFFPRKYEHVEAVLQKA